jgi:hypothetical protein
MNLGINVTLKKKKKRFLRNSREKTMKSVPHRNMARHGRGQARGGGGGA